MQLVFLAVAFAIAAFILIVRECLDGFRRRAMPQIKSVFSLLRAGSPLKLGVSVVKASWRGQSPLVAAYRWSLRVRRAIGGLFDSTAAATATRAVWTTDFTRAMGCLMAAVVALALAFLQALVS